MIWAAAGLILRWVSPQPAVPAPIARVAGLLTGSGHTVPHATAMAVNMARAAVVEGAPFVQESMRATLAAWDRAASADPELARALARNPRMRMTQTEQDHVAGALSARLTLLEGTLLSLRGTVHAGAVETAHALVEAEAGVPRLRLQIGGPTAEPHAIGAARKRVRREIEQVTALIEAAGTMLSAGAGGQPEPRVVHLQNRLNSLGHNVAADGNFGPMTEQAVKAFQGAHGLEAHGKVDAPTTEALRSGGAKAEGNIEIDAEPGVAGAEVAGLRAGEPEQIGAKAPEQKHQQIEPTLFKGHGVGEATGMSTVKDLQGRLQVAGHDVEADGRFGPETESAVKKVQRRHGLNADGIVGPKTTRLLKRLEGRAADASKGLQENLTPYEQVLRRDTMAALRTYLQESSPIELREDWARFDAGRGHGALSDHLATMKVGKTLKLRGSSVKIHKERAATYVVSTGPANAARFGAGPDTEMGAASHALLLHSYAGGDPETQRRVTDHLLRESPQTAALSVTHAPIGKGGTNWITRTAPGNTGQLPAYIQNIRNAIMRDGHDESSATAIAIGRVKAWAAGAGGVSKIVRAAAAKAVAQWEALKGKSAAMGAAKDAKKLSEAAERKPKAKCPTCGHHKHALIARLPYCMSCGHPLDPDGVPGKGDDVPGVPDLDETVAALQEMWSPAARLASAAARKRAAALHPKPVRLARVSGDRLAPESLRQGPLKRGDSVALPKHEGGHRGEVLDAVEHEARVKMLEGPDAGKEIVIRHGDVPTRVKGRIFSHHGMEHHDEDARRDEVKSMKKRLGALKEGESASVDVPEGSVNVTRQEGGALRTFHVAGGGQHIDPDLRRGPRQLVGGADAADEVVGRVHAAHEADAAHTAHIAAAVAQAKHGEPVRVTALTGHKGVVTPLAEGGYKVDYDDMGSKVHKTAVQAVHSLKKELREQKGAKFMEEGHDSDPLSTLSSSKTLAAQAKASALDPVKNRRRAELAGKTAPDGAYGDVLPDQATELVRSVAGQGSPLTALVSHASPGGFLPAEAADAAMVHAPAAAHAAHVATMAAQHPAAHHVGAAMGHLAAAVPHLHTVVSMMQSRLDQEERGLQESVAKGDGNGIVVGRARVRVARKRLEESLAKRGESGGKIREILRQDNGKFAPKGTGQVLSAGDRVKHPSMGSGVVKSVGKDGADVDFKVRASDAPAVKDDAEHGAGGGQSWVRRAQASGRSPASPGLHPEKFGPVPGTDVKDSPGRSTKGNIRNFKAMDDDKLQDTLDDLKAHGKDPEAHKKATEEMVSRIGTDKLGVANGYVEAKAEKTASKDAPKAGVEKAKAKFDALNADPNASPKDKAMAAAALRAAKGAPEAASGGGLGHHASVKETEAPKEAAPASKFGPGHVYSKIAAVGGHSPEDVEAAAKKAGEEGMSIQTFADPEKAHNVLVALGHLPGKPMSPTGSDDASNAGASDKSDELHPNADGTDIAHMKPGQKFEMNSGEQYAYHKPTPGGVFHVVKPVDGGKAKVYHGLMQPPKLSDAPAADAPEAAQAPAPAANGVPEDGNLEALLKKSVAQAKADKKKQ